MPPSTPAMLSAPSAKATLRDVAAKAGVSIATASRCLNGTNGRRDSTRTRVLEAAHALGYSINPLFGEMMRLVRRRAPNRHLGTLAYLVPCSDAQQWARGENRLGRYGAAVRAHAARYGFELSEFPLGLPNFSPARLAKILLARGIDGVLLEIFPNKQFEQRFPWARFSSVLVGHSLHSPGLDCVASDHINGVLIAGETLLRRGHRRIGLVLETSHNADTSGAWVNGYTLLQAQNPELHTFPPLIRGRVTARPFLAWLHEHRIDAVLTLSVLQGEANPMPRWLERAGIRCPADVAIATLDRSYLPLPWTGIDQNSDQIAQASVDLLLTKLRLNERGIPAVPRTLLVHSHWCEGETVRRQETSPESP